MRRTNVLAAGPTGSTVTDARLLDHPDAESIHHEVNGVSLHAVAAGSDDDPLVVLLHGFPDFWFGWRGQIDALVAAGHRVLAPDGRGYGLSGKPDGVAAYRVSELTADVAGLIAAEGRERAHVVGHDWGGGVAWDLARRRPGVVTRLGIVNAPHPAAFQAALASNPRQLWRSRYMAFLQLPRLPEWYLGRDGARPLLDALRATSHPGAFDPGELDHYRAAWQTPGAIRAAVNWYRALREYEEPARDTIEVPTLLLWGEDDRALVPSLAPESVAYCNDGRLERFPDASHWVHREDVERVNDRLIEHLAG